MILLPVFFVTSFYLFFQYDSYKPQKHENHIKIEDKCEKLINDGKHQKLWSKAKVSEVLFVFFCFDIID